MDFNFISKTFLATLGGVPVTLLIMVVSILLSFFPALFLALGQIYKVKGVRSFSVVYLAFIRATPPILLILFFYSLFPSLLNFLRVLAVTLMSLRSIPFTMPLSSLA